MESYVNGTSYTGDPTDNSPPAPLSNEAKPQIYKPPNRRQNRAVDEKKAKLRTSKDVYDRLKWAAESTEIDVSSMYIGYLDRFLGICEMAFNDFDPNESDIPYHRIYYFRSGGPPISPIMGDKGEMCVKESDWPPGSIIYWDRNSRIDLIFNSGDTLLPSKSALGSFKWSSHFTLPAGFREVPFYKYDTNAHQWKPFEDCTPQNVILPCLKIVSFNVLFQLYNPEIVQCDIRWPYLIDFLEHTSADIIALQEVTPAFLSLLQNQPWVQQRYYLTDNSKSRDTIFPYGQILLTRFPPAAVFASRKKADKRWVIPIFLLNHRVLQIPVIHLKSDHGDTDNKAKRKQQLLSLISACASSVNGASSNVIILGDTNFKNDEEVEEMKGTWTDVWPTLNGVSEGADLEGCTYDTMKNPLARQICGKLNTKFRFDRVFINSSSTLLNPTSIQVIGKEMIDFSAPAKCHVKIVPGQLSQKHAQLQLPLSDHYGLKCEFELTLPELPTEEMGQADETRPRPLSLWTPSPALSAGTKNTAEKEMMGPKSTVYTSAAVIIPPTHLWEPIQKIRSEFDPSYNRWMPHINLLYGFVPDIGTNFDEAHYEFTHALKSIQPFRCKLSDIDVFGHGRSCTVFLAPEAECGREDIRKLQTRLQAEYPFCSEQSEKSDSGFTPHLTIAKLFKTSGKNFNHDTAQRLRQWRQELRMTDAWDEGFMVDCVHIISRRGALPFQIRKTVNLGIEESTDGAPGGICTVSPLKKFLLSNHLLPTPEREALRTTLFQELQRLCNYVLNTDAQHGQIDFNWDSVHIIGSGALNCHTDGSDIDVLCCGHEGLSHEQFFKSLEKVVTNTTNQSKLRLHHVVLDTLVPIAKLSMHSIEVDLVYTTCSSPWNLKPKDLNSLTDLNTRSVAGVRDVAKLNEIIPEPWKASFQIAVRAIKFWAKARYIYSKGFGYLGGYPWTLLVAHVVKLMTEAGSQNTSPEGLVTEFFYQFANWKWPEPVAFGSRSGKTHRSNSNIPELMPILAPAYPYNNSARNVTRSTRSLIRKELRLGHEILSRKTETFESNWNTVVNHATFFDKYSQFIRIEFRNGSEQSSQICAGFLDSKLVSLLVYLEKVHSAFVQPFTKVFSTREDESPNVLTAFVGLESQKANAGATPVEDLSDAVEYFQQKFKKWNFKPDESTMNMEVLDKSKGKHCDILNHFIEILIQC